jgi:hypothetical protein
MMSMVYAREYLQVVRVNTVARNVWFKKYVFFYSFFLRF